MVKRRKTQWPNLASLLVCSGVALLSSRVEAQTSIQEQIDRIEAQISELQGQVDRLRKQGIADTGAATAASTRSSQPSVAVALQSEDESVELAKAGQVRFGSTLISMRGFVDASTVFRLHNMTADVGTPFASIPFQSQGDVGRNTEFRGSARASRLGLRIDEASFQGGARLSAYGEIDFLGGGNGDGNQRQVNGYQPRLRQAWLAADTGGDLGLSFLAGQAYSLITPSRGKASSDGQESLPMVLDDQTVVGTDFARQWQVRVVKDLGVVSLGLSLENPQTLWGNAVMPAGFSRFVTTAVPSSNLGVTPISLDAWPDVAYKISVDKTFGHFELFGLNRVFRLDAGPNGGTVSTTSMAAGFNTLVPATTTLDLSASVSYGTGLGRYGAAQLPDATSDSAGKPLAIKALHAQLGLVYRPSARWTAYLYGGYETVYETGTSVVGGQLFGYGNRGKSNNGCMGTVTALETGMAFCNGDTQTVSEITAGGWWTLSQGQQGRLQLGSQVAYLKRTLFADSNGLAPSADNWMLFATLRYTPFWRP